ncbi:MAG: Uma2 family endonuclease [Actinomycetota bacterium]|nr:Uma2 family endonuclease [Actinomycetota bacterium]
MSPSSRETDRFAKPGEYAEAGIPLFWRLAGRDRACPAGGRLPDQR